MFARGLVHDFDLGDGQGRLLPRTLELVIYLDSSIVDVALALGAVL